MARKTPDFFVFFLQFMADTQPHAQASESKRIYENTQIQNRIGLRYCVRYRSRAIIYRPVLSVIGQAGSPLAHSGNFPARRCLNAYTANARKAAPLIYGCPLAASGPFVLRKQRAYAFRAKFVNSVRKPFFFCAPCFPSHPCLWWFVNNREAHQRDSNEIYVCTLRTCGFVHSGTKIMFAHESARGFVYSHRRCKYILMFTIAAASLPPAETKSTTKE